MGEKNKVINFTVGPVISSPEVLEVANKSTPYFRTSEFSNIMLENEKMMLEFLNAPNDSRCVFFTTSGTGAMESCVMNILHQEDKVIVINGGSFGQRFVELCRLHGLNYTEIKCDFGMQIKKEQLDALEGQGYTALLVNMHETSSGILYDMEMISEFCKKNEICLIIDAISSFIADKIDMKELGAAAIITGSQKALAVQPGIALITLSPVAIKRIEENREKCMYLSLKEALKNMERGQTPFTPAVTILLQINTRLNSIKKNGGIDAERENIRKMTLYFRNRMLEYPWNYVVQQESDRSNAVTTLKTQKHNATEIFNRLKDEYDIWICPNGGEYKDDIFRVGHIGYLTEQDYDRLFEAFDDLKRKQLL